MNFQYIDTHAHVNFPEYDEDRNAVIKRALDEGVYIINVGTNIESSRQAISIAEQHEEGIYAIVGIHPHEVMDLVKNNKLEDTLVELKELAKNPKVVGIGECGLDFFKIEEYNQGISVQEVRDAQNKLFKGQIEIAMELNKPLMIHARDSYSETLEILYKDFRCPNINLRGNVHFFAGSVEQAKAFISCGFTVSFNGVITFAKNYEDLIKELPLDKILSETDCPYVAPIPFRGQRAEPVHVKLVVQKIAEIKGISVEEARVELKNNAIKAFFG